MLSEAVKILKGEYTVRAIQEHKMDKAIVFCRTKVDCDNLEHYFNTKGGGEWERHCDFLMQLSVNISFEGPIFLFSFVRAKFENCDARLLL